MILVWFLSSLVGSEQQIILTLANPNGIPVSGFLPFTVARCVCAHRERFVDYE
jgi:hypothetical protein